MNVLEALQSRIDPGSTPGVCPVRPGSEPARHGGAHAGPEQGKPASHHVADMEQDYTFTFSCPHCHVSHTVLLHEVDRDFRFSCPCGETATLTKEEHAAITVLQALVRGLAVSEKKIRIGR